MARRMLGADENMGKHVQAFQGAHAQNFNAKRIMHTYKGPGYSYPAMPHPKTETFFLKVNEC